jgi:hypothetical protein
MEAPQEQHNALNISALPHRARKARLFELVRAFPSHVPYSERLHQIAAQTGISPKILFQLAKRNQWQARLALEVAAEKEREAYAASLQATAPPPVDIPATRIASNVKGIAWTLLSAMKEYINVSVLMLTHYSSKIAMRIAEAGGLAHLDATAAKEISELQAKLSFYAKSLQPYMTPGPVSTLLATIDFSSRLPATDEAIEATHFTVHALQSKLLELGMGSAFDNPRAAIEGFTTEPLPILSGHVNTSGNGPIQYEDPTQPDLI